METFLASFGLVFVAELGDKSQLMVLALAARYRRLPVLVGLAAGAGLLNGLSVAIGAVVATAVPTTAVTVAGGLAFLAFAAWTLRESSGPDDAPAPLDHAVGPAVAAVAVAFLLAELGDKTMLVTITLAARSSPLATWAGATLGLVAADALAIAVGGWLRGRLAASTVKLGSAIAFAVFGVLLLVSALPL